MAVGGEAVAREPSGRVVFVAGALPGELVEVELHDERARFARGSVAAVLEPVAERVEPPCPHVADGCGGCDWQHVRVDAQHQLRLDVVRQVLERDGRLVDPVVRSGPTLAAQGLRTTVRGVADPDGRFSFRRRRSHELVAVDACLVAHPFVDEVIAGSSFPPGAEVVIRVGARTGERLVLVSPSAQGTEVPDGVVAVGADELRAGRRVWIYEEVAGRRWRVSAEAFFQASPEGAEALVASARAFIDTHASSDGRLVDLCCGMGLFAGALGRTGRW
jgi:23S rRNA (uracil1939-C5)-methyltransferase